MCQLIEVTWFIWKLSADQLIVLLDRDQYTPYSQMADTREKTGA